MSMSLTHIHIGQVPQYLSDCVSTASEAGGRYRLRSTSSAAYVLPRTRTIDLENVVSSTPVQPPGTLFHPIFMTSLTLVLSENDSRMYFLIVLITDYCWRSWTCRIAAPYKFFIDWLIDLALRSELSFGHFTLNVRTVRIYPTSAKVSLVRTVLGPKCLVPFGRHLMAYLFSCLN